MIMEKEEIDRTNETLLDWLSARASKWIDIMNDDNCPCTRPMLFIRDHEGKSIDVMVTLEKGLRFSKFVSAVPGIIETGKENDEPASGMAYYFHTDDTPDENCIEKTTLHVNLFSPASDGVLGHVHASVCVNKDDDGNNIVNAELLPKKVFHFPGSMVPLFENPFFPENHLKVENYPDHFAVQ